MNLNGKPTNPGELKVPITLQGATITTDAGGAQHPTWANLTSGSVLAKWENVHGIEAWQSDAAEAVSAATVTIRYRSDVTAACSILKGSTRYEIVSIDDIQERHEYLEIKVKLSRGTL